MDQGIEAHACKPQGAPKAVSCCVQSSCAGCKLAVKCFELPDTLQTFQSRLSSMPVVITVVHSIQQNWVLCVRLACRLLCSG